VAIFTARIDTDDVVQLLGHALNWWWLSGQNFEDLSDPNSLSTTMVLQHRSPHFAECLTQVYSNP
jgi:hypothetical protein